MDPKAILELLLQHAGVVGTVLILSPVAIGFVCWKAAQGVWTAVKEMIAGRDRMLSETLERTASYQVETARAFERINGTADATLRQVEKTHDELHARLTRLGEQREDQNEALREDLARQHQDLKNDLSYLRGAKS